MAAVVGHLKKEELDDPYWLADLGLLTRQCMNYVYINSIKQAIKPINKGLSYVYVFNESHFGIQFM
jgi:hypothetical protein